MIHLFKASDKSWVFSGTTIPSNLESEDYVEGVLPEGETWDIEYNYTWVDGVATKGDKINTSGFVEDNGYVEKRLNEYPPLEDFADAMYWNSKGDDSKLIEYYAACEAVKTKYPKG